MTGTINPPMPSRCLEFSRRAFRWVWPTALLALAPKCLLCLAAYAGLGATLGLGGPEVCGGSNGGLGSWASSLAWLGLAGGLGGFGFRVNYRSMLSHRRANGIPVKEERGLSS